MTVQVCLASTCVSSTFDGGQGNSAYVDLPFTSTDPVDVSVGVSSSTGVLLPVRTYRVVPHSYSPNGPECEPTVNRAELSVTPSESVFPSPT